MNICKTRLNMITHAVNYTFKYTVMSREKIIRTWWGEGGPNRWPGMQMSSSGKSYNVARLANALMTLLHIYGYGCSLTAEAERSVVTDCDVECRPYRQTAPPPRPTAAVTNLVCSLWLVSDKVEPTASSYIQGTAVTSYRREQVLYRQSSYEVR